MLRKTKQNKKPYLSVNVFSTKYQLGTLFLRPLLEKGPRHEDLTVYRPKVAPSSSVIFRRRVLVRPGIELATSRSADLRSTNQANLPRFNQFSPQTLLILVCLLKLSLIVCALSTCCDIRAGMVNLVVKTFRKMQRPRHKHWRLC